MQDENFRSKILYLIAGILFSLFLILLHSINVLSPLYSTVSYLTNPLRYSLNSLSSTINDFSYSITNLSSIRDENLQLKEETQKMTEELAELEIMRDENEKLKEQLNIIEIGDFDSIESRVIGGDARLDNYILINKGRKAGIKEKDVVVVGKYAIGEIVSLDEYSAKVKLITSLNSNIPAQTINTKAKGLVNGSFGQSLLIENVLPDEKIDLEDIVVTSGVNSNYPFGLILGKVSQVHNSDAGITKSADIRLIIDLRKLDTVFVIVKK